MLGLSKGSLAMRLDLRLGGTDGGGAFARFRPLADAGVRRLLPSFSDSADLASRRPDLARKSAFRRRFASTISWYDGYDMPSKVNDSKSMLGSSKGS